MATLIQPAAETAHRRRSCGPRARHGRPRLQLRRSSTPTSPRSQLKVGKVLACVKVPKADKLLQLTVDLGEGTPRTIVSGIAEAYTAEAVIGKNVVVVANLKPRALKGIESRGMILTAGRGRKRISCCSTPARWLPARK